MLAPAAALSQGTILSIFAILQVLGTLAFAWLGVYTSKDFFLLLGNIVCAFGAGVWVFMLLEEGGNPTWITVFLVLGCLSCYSVIVMFGKYRREGIDSDSDSDEGEEATKVSADPPQRSKKRLDGPQAPATASATGTARRRKK